MCTAQYLRAKKREKNKREKKNLESRCSSPALSVARGRRIARTIRRPWLISSPAGDFFSPHGEKKCLPAWEEGTRRPYASQSLWASVEAR
ncbi:hypothetical protein B296_00029071 [Ensete ventricosum]|uniref:Uncharacterized protein n=1 Tax=Ensete ventricosum TaxID=4639 RepID=A0A426XJ18_ENSVE|nr:hypothetical protein B296_00029071 [Ensete ventricosum]